MPRGVIFVANSTWKLSAESNRQTRIKLAKELDKLTALVDQVIEEETAAAAKIHQALGEFGDMLLDSDIRYAEVL